MSQDLLRQKLNERYEKSARRTRFQISLNRNWWLIAVLILGIYSGLPIAAPVLMTTGATGPANAIYDVYQFACHQFAFRSVFLFGEQAFYPRASTGVDNIDSFEERAAQSERFRSLYSERLGSDVQLNQVQVQEALDVWNEDLQLTAREFKGDDQMGYKIALCQRDIAIYLAMVLGGLAYGFVRHRLRPVPLWLYVFLGLGPIGLDGFSQLLGYPPFEFWDPRETLPAFRLMTGALFGLMNVWLAFPYLNASFEDSAERLEQKLEMQQEELEVLLQRAKNTKTAPDLE